MGNCETSSKMCAIQQWVRTVALVTIAASAVTFVSNTPAERGGRDGGPRGGRPVAPAPVVDAPAGK